MNLVKQNRNTFPVMDELFKDFLGGTQYVSRMVPPVNINETETEYTVQLQAPGFKKEDFKLEIEKDVLTIAANATEQEEIAGKFTRREFRSVSFKRTFTLPETVNEEGVRAGYEAGILNITLPKKEEQQKEKRLIEIA